MFLRAQGHLKGLEIKILTKNCMTNKSFTWGVSFKELQPGDTDLGINLTCAKGKRDTVYKDRKEGGFKRITSCFERLVMGADK